MDKNILNPFVTYAISCLLQGVPAQKLNWEPLEEYPDDQIALICDMSFSENVKERLSIYNRWGDSHPDKAQIDIEVFEFRPQDHPEIFAKSFPPLNRKAAEIINHLLHGIPEETSILDDIREFPEEHQMLIQALRSSEPGERMRILEPWIGGNPNKHIIYAQIYNPNIVKEQPADLPKRRGYFFTAQDALQPQPPIDWVIDGIFSAGSVSIVVGDAKSKKTYILLDAAVSVATGENWLEHKVTQGPVLMIDEESGPRRLKRRLGEIQRGHFIKDAGTALPVYCQSLSGYNFCTADDVNELQRLILETQARFVILDALADIMPGRNENDVKDVQPLFLALRQLAELTQCAIVVIHHNNKAGQQRGSTAIPGAVDLMLQVRSNPKSSNIVLTADKARDVEPFEFAAHITFSDGTTYLAAAEKPEEKVNLSKSQQYVLRYLIHNDGQAPLDEIMQRADTCAPTTAKGAVYSLTAMKYTNRLDDGGPGAKAIYCLTEEGKKAAELC